MDAAQSKFFPSRASVTKAAKMTTQTEMTENTKFNFCLIGGKFDSHEFPASLLQRVLYS